MELTWFPFAVSFFYIIGGQNVATVRLNVNPEIYSGGVTTTTIITGSTFKVSPSSNGQILINGVPTNSYRLIVNGKPVSFTSGRNGGFNLNGNPIDVEAGKEQSLNFHGVQFTFTRGPNDEITVSRKNPTKPAITINTLKPITINTTPTVYTIFFNNEPATISHNGNGVVMINGEPHTIPTGKSITVTINGKPATIELGPNNVVIINKEPVTANSQIVPITPRAIIYTIFINGEPITVTTGDPGVVIINGESHTIPDGQIISITVNKKPIKVSVNINGEVVLNGTPVTENMQKIESPRCYETFMIFFTDSGYNNISRGDDQLFVNGVPVSAPKGKEITTEINGYPTVLMLSEDNKILANRKLITKNYELVTSVPIPGGTDFTSNVNGRIVHYTVDGTSRLFVEGSLINVPRGKTVVTHVPGVSVNTQYNDEVYVNGVKLVSPNGTVAKTVPIPRGPQSPTDDSTGCPPPNFPPPRRYE